jgi:hypothetical protein
MIVIDEIRRGDPIAANVRMQFVRALPVLKISNECVALSAEITKRKIVPMEFQNDALHIAVACAQR